LLLCCPLFTSFDELTFQISIRHTQQKNRLFLSRDWRFKGAALWETVERGEDWGVCQSPGDMSTLKVAITEAADELTQGGNPRDGSKANLLALIDACFHQSGPSEGKRIAGVVGLSLDPLEDADRDLVIQQTESAATVFCEATGRIQAAAAQTAAEQAAVAAAAARLPPPRVPASTSEAAKFPFLKYTTDHVGSTMNALGVTESPHKGVPGLMALGAIPAKAKGDHTHYDNLAKLLEKDIRLQIASTVTDGSVEYLKFAFLLGGRNPRDVARDMVSPHLFAGVVTDPAANPEGLPSAACMSITRMADLFEKSKGPLPPGKEASEELIPPFPDAAECNDTEAALKAALVVHGCFRIFFGKTSAVARHAQTAVATLSACVIRQRFDSEFRKIQARPKGNDAGHSLLTLMLRQTDRLTHEANCAVMTAIGDLNGSHNFAIAALESGETDSQVS
jgi:hypothetical protein